jgi:signal transduction histidine kinase
VQESLTNVVRHAHATRAMVTISEVDGSYRVRVQDNGTASVPRGEGGRGITGMRERAELLGGSLGTTVSSDGGFLVTATIPARGSDR